MRGADVCITRSGGIENGGFFEIVHILATCGWYEGWERSFPDAKWFCNVRIRRLC